MLMTRILINRNLKRSFFESGIIRFAPVTNVFVPRLFSNSVKKNQSIDDVEKNFFSKYLIIENETIFSRKSSKVVKYSFTFLGFSLILLGTYVIFEICKPEVVESELPLWQQYVVGVWKRVQSFTLFIQEPSREKLLPDPVPYPYYQPPYTLVLEFTDVLAHPDWTYSTGWRFQKRPGLDYMLENLVGLYEIVVFTAEPGITIFPVIEAIDPKNLISYKLVRDSTHFVEGHHVKNLDKLNRDLKKVIVVDWNSQSLKFHPDNHLNIPRWKGENEDLALLDLTAFLKTIATTEIEDVRDVLKYYKNFENPLREFRNKQKEYLEQKNKLDQVPPEGPSIKRVFSYIM